jgi:hypothetical protein
MGRWIVCIRRPTIAASPTQGVPVFERQQTAMMGALLASQSTMTPVKSA